MMILTKDKIDYRIDCERYELIEDLEALYAISAIDKFDIKSSSLTIENYKFIISHNTENDYCFRNILGVLAKIEEFNNDANLENSIKGN